MKDTESALGFGMKCEDFFSPLNARTLWNRVLDVVRSINEIRLRVSHHNEYLRFKDSDVLTFCLIFFKYIISNIFYEF